MKQLKFFRNNPTRHEQRVKEELIAVGVTKYGFKKFAIHYLPKLIHDDEHIGGIVYGRYTDKKGGNKWNEGMLIATNLKIIFLDHKPGYTVTDDISYKAVSGVNLTSAVFSAVTLHTRLGDFQIRFVNVNCANIFISYVEERQLEDTAQAR